MEASTRLRGKGGASSTEVLCHAICDSASLDRQNELLQDPTKRGTQQRYCRPNRVYIDVTQRKRANNHPDSRNEKQFPASVWKVSHLGLIPPDPPETRHFFAVFLSFGPTMHREMTCLAPFAAPLAAVLTAFLSPSLGAEASFSQSPAFFNASTS